MNTQWFYLLDSAAHTKMETPLTPFQLFIKILQFVKSINNDVDDVDQMTLFNVLKENGEAKKRDLDSLYKIQQRGIQLRDDDDLSDEALMEVAAIGDRFSSTTLPNSNTLTTARQFHRSAVTRAESATNADAKTNTAHRVEENVPAMQFQ